MYSTIIERAKRFLQAQRKKSIWHRAVSMMAAVVVFVTTYMLILPAITMEKETYCGQENQPGHIHSTSCYEQRTDEIINEEAAAQPAVSLASGDTSVGLFSIEGIEEVTDPGLEDEDSAASSQNGAESESESESASETESESEIEIETSLYLCGLEEHEHEESCYTKDEKGEPVLICEKEEHVHDDSCLDKETESETATETETEKVETEIETETESDTEIGTEFSTSAETEQEAVTETETGAEVATETEGEIGTESESKAGTETVPETEAVSGTEMETEIVAETEDGDESELSTENETKAESLSETEQETESEVATEQKTESEVMTEQETESESDKESIISTDNSTADNNTVNNIEETDAGKLPNTTLPIPLIPRANSMLALRTLNYSGLDIVPSTPIEEPGPGIGEGKKETEESDSESETEPETSVGTEQSETEPETITSAEESETESETITGTEQSETESQTTQATEKAETELETATESEKLETESESTADSENYGELICHLEEHHHSDACYTASEDIASVSTANTANIANTADTKDAAAVNATDASAEQTPTCGLEEHVHDASCYAENDAQGANGEEEPNAGDTNRDPADFSPFVTGVEGSGTKYDKATDYYSTHLKVKFELTKTQAGTGPFMYDYPKELVVPDTLLNTDHIGKDENGNDAFTFRYIKNADNTYSVKIEFLESYLKKCGDKITGHWEFDGKLAGSTQKEDGSITSKFSDKAELRVEPDKIEYEGGETRNYDLNIAKAVERKSGNVLHYTVTIGSVRGTPGNIELTDIWTAQNLDGANIANVVISEQSCDYKRYTWGTDTFPAADTKKQIDIGYKYDTNTKRLTATLPQIEGKAPIEIYDPYGLQYQSKQYIIEYDYLLGNLENGTEYKADNTATATSTNSQKGESLNVHADASKTITTNKLTKAGSYNADEEKISWTLQVNSDQFDITGYELTDSMLSTLKESDITINPTGGRTVVSGADGKIQKIQFSAVDEDGENHQSYTITYLTTKKMGWTDQEVTNTATLKKDDDEVTETETVKVPGKKTVTKKLADSKLTEDKTKMELTWNFAAEIPESGTGDNSVLHIEDTLTDNVSASTTDHYMTLPQIQEWGKEVGSSSASQYPWLGKADAATFELKKEDGSWVTYANANPSDKFIGFRFDVKGGLKQEDNPKLTYKSYADLANTKNDVVYQYENGIKFDGEDGGDKYEYTQITPVQKMDGNNSKENTEHTSEHGLVTWKVKVYMKQDLGNGQLKIIDTLPDGVVLEGLSFGAESGMLNANIAEDGTITLQGGNGQVLVDGSTYDKETGIVTLLVKNQEGQNYPPLKQGNNFWVTYTCRVKDLSVPKYVLTNRVHVDIGDNPYGEDDHTQTIKIPERVVKMDGQERTETFKTPSADGTVVWKVKINLSDDYSVLDILDELPKGTVTDSKGNSSTGPLVELTNLCLGSKDNQQEVQIASDGTIQTTLSTLNLTGKYNAEQGTVSLKLQPQEGQNPPEYFQKDHTLWLTYTCKLKNMPEPGKSVEITLPNKVSVTTQKPGEKPEEYGKSEQTQILEVNRPKRVIKMDGSKNEEDNATNSQDGVVTWKVKVYLEEDFKQFTVTDQLPALEGENGEKIPDVSLVSLQYGSEGAEKTALISSEDAQKVIAAAADDDVLDLTGSTYNTLTGEITLQVKLKEGKTLPDYLKKGGYFWLTFTCKVNELPEEGKTDTYTLKNTVTVVDENDTYGKDDQTQTHTVHTPEKKKVDKNGEWVNNDRLLRYTVDINPNGQDLLEGGDDLTLKDVMNFRSEPGTGNLKINVLLIQGSVELCYAAKDVDGRPLKDEGGHLIAGAPVPSYMWSWTYEVSQDVHDAPKKYHTITARIPDKEALVLKYNYQVGVNAGWANPNFTIQNDVELVGVSQGNDHQQNSQNWEDSSTSGGVVSEKQYLFNKIDSSDYGLLLDGAKFALYKYNPNATSEDKFEFTGYAYETVGGKFTVDGDAGYGTTTITAFEKNTAYYVVETQAPAGYLMPDEPQKFYFHFPDSTVQNTAYPGTLTASQFTQTYNAADLEQSSRTAYCKNTKSTADIIVMKKWLSSTGEDITASKTGEIKVNLYQKEHTQKPDESISGGSQDIGLTGGVLYGDNPYTITSDGDQITETDKDRWTRKISDLPKEGTKNGQTVYYTYYVQEVVESEGAYAPTYSNTGGIVSGLIVVTNTEPEEPKTTVTVTKDWDENGTGEQVSHASDQVTVELWKKGENGQDEKVGDSVTLPIMPEASSGNTTLVWSYTWDGLDENSKYYVKETSVTPGYTTKYIYKGEEYLSESARNVDASPGDSVIVKNIRNTTSLQVKKKWVSSDGTEKNETGLSKLSDITVDLYRKQADGSFIKVEGKSITLGHNQTGQGYSDHGWSYTWASLSEGTYCVKESSKAAGYSNVTYQIVSEAESSEGGNETAMPSETPEDAAAEKGTIQITNQEDSTNISVEKVWSNGNQNHTNDTVTMQLYSSTTPPQETSQSESESETERQTESESQQETETKIEIKLAITEWKDANGDNAEPMDEGWLWFQIFESDAAGNPFNWKKPLDTGGVTSLTPGNWSFTLNNLTGQILDARGNVKETKYYYVQYGNYVETSSNKQAATISPVSGFKVSGTSHTQSLTATLADTGESGGGEAGTAKTIIIQCANGNDTPQPMGAQNIIADAVQIQLYAYNDGGTDYKIETIEGLTIIGPEIERGLGGTGICSFKYFVYGLNSLKSDSVRLVVNTGWQNFDAEVYFSDEHHYSSISPIDVPQTSAISTFALTSNNAVRTASNMAGSVSALLLPERVTPVQEPITLGANEKNSWNYTWSNLPRTDSDGNKLYYYVKETSTGNYSTTYAYEYIDSADPSKGIKLVTVTNTPPDGPGPEPETTSIKVNKQWFTSSGSMLDVGANVGSIKFELYRQAGENAEKILVGTYDLVYSVPGEDGKWTKTISGLEKSYSDETGKHDYIYSVVEREVNGVAPSEKYDVEYETTGSVLTIKNKEKQTYVLPETGGSGTQPYTLGGILLTSMAALLIGIKKKKRRKEEQCSS